MIKCQPAVFDVECYSNFFLVLMKRVEDGTVLRFQISPSVKLNKTGLLSALAEHLLIGFNSNNYDIPMIQLALTGKSAIELKRASDRLIVGEMRVRDFMEEYGLKRHTWDHIDLIEVAPLKASLKIYAGRLHAKKLQDLPFAPDLELTAEDAAKLVEYCGNDLANTAILFEELRGQIALRESLSKQYRTDLRSKSDAQVAEKIIASEIEKINGEKPKRPSNLEGTSFQYKVPEYIAFQTPELQQTLAEIRKAVFVVGNNGEVICPPELSDLIVRVGNGQYRMGIGGLHSCETRVILRATESSLLIDRDVTSYYPSIILNQGLYPSHLGPAFLTVYKTLFERRVAAKKRVGEIKARLKELKTILA